jgi:uncharacterized membrane-anchored protein
MKTYQYPLTLFLGIIILIGVSSNVYSIPPKTDTEEDIWSRAAEFPISGPSAIKFLDQAILHLPEKYIFISPNLINGTSEGNNGSNIEYGMILHEDKEERWEIYIDYFNCGYRSDSSVSSWEHIDIFELMQENLDHYNKDYPKAPIEFVRWVLSESYDINTHILRWAVTLRHVGTTDKDNEFIEYIVYFLGKDGRFKLSFKGQNLSIDEIELHMDKILNNLRYNEGKKHEDFVFIKVHYILISLIAVVLAKSAGLLTILYEFLAKLVLKSKKTFTKHIK